MSSIGFQEISSNINIAAAVSPQDALADTILGLLWLGAFYVIGMLWTTLALIDRWRGPHGVGDINFLAVVAAVLLAVPWPAVLVIMAIM